MKQYGIENINQDRKRKILITGAFNINLGGGISQFLFNMLSNMDCSGFCIHIYTSGEIISQYLADLLIKYGIVIYTGNWKEGEALREKVYQDLEYLTSLYNYDVIHCNSAKVWINYYSCYFGIKNHIPKRIVHSHSALLPRIKPEVQKQDDIYRKYILEHATDFLSCSQKAATWLYGPEFQEYIILKNGINLEKYRFDKEIRSKYRKELEIENKFVIGHVGRFAEVKNHKFLVDIFMEITRHNRDSILLMAGDGELFEEIKYKAEMCGLKDKCMFLGIREDVPELLQAMDVFVLPSLFEGFPVYLVEAQASGLPCIISEEITEEVCLCEEVKRIPLNRKCKILGRRNIKI
ncbi:MAG: glycosyltransferase family 1 protein [Lachnospiraceae bacterium]|nr:glycosyltransferase family 1 protein [Lachnospiraceae bacterium]